VVDDENYIIIVRQGQRLVVFGKVSGLGVVIPPGGKIIVALAWASINLDLDTTNLFKIRSKNENLMK